MHIATCHGLKVTVEDAGQPAPFLAILDLQEAATATSPLAAHQHRRRHLPQLGQFQLFSMAHFGFKNLEALLKLGWNERPHFFCVTSSKVILLSYKKRVIGGPAA